MTHQTWHNHPFSQRNKATKRAVGWRKGSLDKIWKSGVDNIGTLRQLCTNIDRKRVVSCYPSSVIFPSIFLLTLCGSKNSIFNRVSKFNPSSTNSYFIAIVKVLFLTHYLLEKHFKEGYIFSVFFLESQNFTSSPGPLWALHKNEFFH